MPKSKRPAAKPSGTKGSAPVPKSKKAPPPRPVAAVKGGRAPSKEGASTKGEGAVAAPAVKKWPKGGPTKADLRRYRDRLLEMRRNLLTSTKELASEALKSSGQDFSVDHMADHGSDNYEQDFSLKLLEGEAEQLADIRDALFKIDGRTDVPFGLCEACSDSTLNLCESCPWIPSSRLDVVPHARLCVQTKEIEENRRT